MPYHFGVEETLYLMVEEETTALILKTSVNRVEPEVLVNLENMKIYKYINYIMKCYYYYYYYYY
ncbi:hypothetical protein PIROE2DRAFT_13035 [Piromyces sp. E2]|nr:hypothetical protein PIROE2DRAFT_13035 [Piromyces sp. E2]|eukprot:OUM61041.1 hypothetical protein PIROE2DRAFT_13035 [Piromyces sp. E2]